MTKLTKPNNWEEEFDKKTKVYDSWNSQLRQLDWIKDFISHLLQESRREVMGEVGKVIGEDDDYMDTLKNNPFLHRVNPFSFQIEATSPEVSMRVQNVVDVRNLLRKEQRQAIELLKIKK